VGVVMVGLSVAVAAACSVIAAAYHTRHGLSMITAIDKVWYGAEHLPRIIERIRATFGNTQIWFAVSTSHIICCGLPTGPKVHQHTLKPT